MRWKPLRREPRPSALLEVITQITHDVIADIRRNPPEVRHTIERKIPRPTRMHFVIEDSLGRRYQTPTLDLSYRDGAPVNIPVTWLYPDAPPSAGYVTLRAALEYEPKDRLKAPDLPRRAGVVCLSLGTVRGGNRLVAPAAP